MQLVCFVRGGTLLRTLNAAASSLAVVRWDFFRRFVVGEDRTVTNIRRDRRRVRVNDRSLRLHYVTRDWNERRKIGGVARRTDAARERRALSLQTVGCHLPAHCRITLQAVRHHVVASL